MMSKYLSLLLAFLLVNLNSLNATMLLGKVAVYTSSSRFETYPLVSGSRINYDHKAIIKVAGGTLVADKGAALLAFDLGEKIGFQVEKGSVYFRIHPSKGMVSFKTIQSEISTPGVTPASTDTITGSITVSDKSTVLEVNEGSLSVNVLGEQTRVLRISNGKSHEIIPDGAIRVDAGEKVILAQAELAQAELEEKVEKPKRNWWLLLFPSAVFGGALLGGLLAEEEGEASPIR